MPRNLVLLTYDSCRFDSAQRARTPNLDRLGAAERRYAYASWTAPSHFTYLMGLVPHRSPTGVYASEVYKEDFGLWGERLDLPGMDFGAFLPGLSLPAMLRTHGYATRARVSMPVLNPRTILANAFDDYRLMPDHNDFAGIVADMEFSRDQPTFWFCNLGETHYPYMLEGHELPHISGLHGVAKELARGGDAGGHVQKGSDVAAADFVTDDSMRMLHGQQVRCVEYLDGLLGALFDKAPADTWVMVMGDHGEAFGEGGYFGHGPVMHEAVFAVPFVEARRPTRRTVF